VLILSANTCYIYMVHVVTAYLYKLKLHNSACICKDIKNTITRIIL